MTPWYQEVEEIVGADSMITSESILRSYLEVVNSDNMDSGITRGDFVVIRPKTTAEVVRIVKFASKNCVGLVPRGAGTSREGAVLPIDRSIILDFTEMSHISKIDAENGLVVAQPGIALDMLEARLNDHGLSIGHGPEPMDAPRRSPIV